MSSFGKRVVAPANKRRSPRRQVRVVGSAVTLDGSKSVIVEDICPAGAKLVGRDLPEPGTEILVRTTELDVLGYVAWAKSDVRGVIFEEQGAPSAGQCLAMQLGARAKTY
jgi:hypothetical protein